MKKIRISLAQINPTLGDLSGNIKKILACIRRARAKNTDVIAFPELAVTGYPPEDLLLKSEFVKDNLDALQRVRAASKDITVIAGFVDERGERYNAAAVMSNTKLIDIYHKIILPNYGVFDEHRYFKAGTRYPVYELGGICIGVNICEDIWHENGPAKVQSMAGAQVIVNINASPYRMGKGTFRENLVSERAKECGAAIAYVNTVGGQDELVFDGGSFAVNESGEFVVKGNHFCEELITFDMEIRGKGKKGRSKKTGRVKSVDLIKIPPVRGGEKKPLRKKKVIPMTVNEKVYNALITGTRDYVTKNGFKGVVIGMSGGIDSALVTTIAVDALGKENVHGIFMPSVYTSKESYEDASGHAKNLGIKFTKIPIDNVLKAYTGALSKSFRGLKSDITEENLQARIRGNLLMAFSNKFGWIVLTTGNKSEMSVGYATLYGDMAGGFAVIKDVPKILVYDLCKWRNESEGKYLIPERVLIKEPTAELKPDHKDTDSLPPYSTLDPILKAYVEDDLSFEEIGKMDCDIESTRRVIGMVDRSEYKRRQAPPGIKITPRAFGKDRRFPITNRYRSY